MNQRGFTLIEVLIAMLLAAFLLTALWFSFLHGSFNVNSARHTAQGVDLCEAGVEAIQSRTQAELASLMGNSVTENLSLDYSEDQSAAIACTRTTTVSDTDDDGVYEIAVTVGWTERYLGGTKTRQITLNTQIARLSP
ncbi:MAG: prepilin-type N-terminal cleavage/methylation domain-containing protein [Verrucomicrobia bacterium]|nr:prepilin-type N-terminal cleavage/methylation domain-containing protein [Verrucomicrobiota bacterium]